MGKSLRKGRGVGRLVLPLVLSLSTTVACQMTQAIRGGDDLEFPRVGGSERFTFTGLVSTIAFSKGGRVLAVGGCRAVDSGGSAPCTRGVVYVRNLNGTGPETSYTLPRAVTALAVSPDGSRWVAGDAEGHLILSTDAKRVGSGPFRQKGEITALTFSPDGKWVASGSLDSSFPLGFLDMVTGGVLKPSMQFEPVSALAFSPDGKDLAVGMTNGRLVVWDFTSRSMPVRVTPNSGERYAITRTTFSSDGRLLAYGRRDGKVVIVDRGSGHSLVEFTGSSAVSALAFSPDGRYVALGQDNGRVLLVKSQEAQQIWSKRHILPVADLAYSLDGTSLAVAVQHSVYLYSVDGGALQHR